MYNYILFSKFSQERQSNSPKILSDSSWANPWFLFGFLLDSVFRKLFISSLFTQILLSLKNPSDLLKFLIISSSSLTLSSFSISCLFSFCKFFNFFRDSKSSFFPKTDKSKRMLSFSRTVVLLAWPPVVLSSSMSFV